MKDASAGSPRGGALEGKCVVIIGGTAGLGISAARACLESGGSLVILGKSAEDAGPLVEEFGRRLNVIEGDARDPAVIDQVFELAQSEYGGVDSLYHVAGGSGRRFGDGPIDELSDAGWEETMRLNLTTVFYSNRAAVRSLRMNERPGSILNVTSVLATSPSPRYFATHAYAAAKAGITGLTTSLAAHYASSGIRVNAIAPGLIETPMSQRAAGDDQIMAYVRCKQPLDGGRIGLPGDLDAAVIYFLSDQSRFVTGQVLSIDGGWGVSGF